MNGICTSSSLAPTTCPFGDDIVTQDVVSEYNITLPSYQSTCQQAFLAAQQSGMSIGVFCLIFNSTCCQSCMSKKNHLLFSFNKYLLILLICVIIEYNALDCKDLDIRCDKLSSLSCDNAYLNGQLMSYVCPVKCNTCPSKLIFNKIK